MMMAIDQPPAWIAVIGVLAFGAGGVWSLSFGNFRGYPLVAMVCYLLVIPCVIYALSAP
jgi:hypothetical protein